MIKIASLHFGSGGGHLQNGITLWNFFKQIIPKQMHFSLLTDSDYDPPLEDETLDLLPIALEPEKLFTKDRDTMLYQYLKHINPDIIIVDSIWLPVLPILDKVRGKKIFFSCYLPDVWFNPPRFKNGEIFQFTPEAYDLVFSLEPQFLFNGSVGLPPLINNSESEIKTPDLIRTVLDVPSGKKLALLAHLGHEGELDRIMKESKIDRDEYCFRTLSMEEERSRKLFPLVHYMGGVDLAIGGCGYHFFYETKFHGIPSIFFPQPRIGNEQHWRLEKNDSYNGPYDGATQMVEQILSIM